MVGALTGIVLTGGLLALVSNSTDSVQGYVGMPLLAVLYPLSAVLGYDLSTGASGQVRGKLLRAAGYVGAMALAHGAVVGGLAVCNALGALGDSVLWGIAYAVCVAVAPLGRWLVVGLTRWVDARPGVLLAGSIVVLVFDLFGYMIVTRAYIVRVDVD